MAIVLTQRPLIAMARGGRNVGAEVHRGVWELVDGFKLGARNMIGIAIATATAGIVVGTVTLTGMGLMMTDFVEFLSGGNVIAMLLLTALICLVLGMGIPTTANYILVATLMAPVVVELGAQAGIAIPLIAVHLFVFYFGIMADITPPVGLASFAAAAIAREDPIKIGFQGSIYALRTAILPFVFIFSPQMLLIDIANWFEGILIVVMSTVAVLLFSAGSMNWFVTKSRWWESVVLLVCCFALFRPSFFMDQLAAPYAPAPAKQMFEVAEKLPEGSRLTFVIQGTNLEGEDVTKTVSLPMGKPMPGRDRIAATGVRMIAAGDRMQIGQIQFGSYAKRTGIETGFTVKHLLLPADRPSPYLVFIPALLLVGGVAALQWRRKAAASKAKAAPAAT
jgi:hypothetical protein